ncbi:SPOR domain-containing protein [Thalassospira lucentensis]|uniref:SPOR domain-containing protein n=1 Tax=Thalassospira lucentensis TaxID=168935 RepID=UPI00138ACF9A|nr:SPOR domain-containing protein [Thalassospira lucentensis]
METPPGERAALDRATCGLFFDQDHVRDQATETASSTDMPPISLDASPQDNLLQAISYDLDGHYDNARKLYVWLTASSPDLKIDLDCGQSIRLSGSINSLAQRRLVALDRSKPQFARSAEIDTVVAAATVAPGPDLPNPPQVDRNRDFYKTGGVVTAEPEDRASPTPPMEMNVSENTARLTSVERKTPAAAPAPVTSTPSATINAAAPTKAASKAPVAVVAPVPVLKETAKPAPKPDSSMAVATMSAPTIAGDQQETTHTGAVVATNARPVEQGELEITDSAPATSMIEVPMASKAPATAKATPTTQTEPMVAPSGPYYAVQLAAYRTRERAESSWSVFQSRSNGVLTNAAHDVSTIAIEGQGLFFRLITGQYATNDQAAQACTALKNQGVDCLVRRITP